MALHGLLGNIGAEKTTFKKTLIGLLKPKDSLK
jgi:ABC-type uncharacterized transport system ATPase subunit